MLRKALYASMFVVCGMVGGSAIAKPVKTVKTLVSAPYNGKKISKSGCTWANEGDITEAFKTINKMQFTISIRKGIV